MTARPLWPPRRDTPLDRAWRRRQWRLERAHDDWGLHAASGDPRAPIHRASGLVRHCRQSVRDKVRAYRRTVVEGIEVEPAISAKNGIVQAIRDYRLAIAELARAVGAFEKRNAEIGAFAPPNRQTSRENTVTETIC